MSEPLTFICLNCGKCHTYYGEEARILHEIKSLWNERLILRNNRYTSGIMANIQAEAKCCNCPEITYHRSEIK